ncbi:MAG TPA: LytTR family DNA-binding domain-containing protein, partial [Flavisolibacter sp.]
FKKHLLDKNLSDLESELDSDRFFRANRQFIVNSDYIKGFRTYERVKLQVELNVDIPFNNTIIVSQETAASFRQWLYEA